LFIAPQARNKTGRAMNRGTLGRKTAVWRTLGAVCAAILYAISVSGAAYDVTTPVAMPHHELVRKIYAVGAFALLGFFLVHANFRRARSVGAGAVAIGLYSYLIELGQIFIDRSTETFAEHGFDVASGVAGGALGAWVAWILAGRLTPPRRIEAAAIAVSFAVLAWYYTLTYAALDH
jgi:hypothetical protein